MQYKIIAICLWLIGGCTLVFGQTTVLSSINPISEGGFSPTSAMATMNTKDLFKIKGYPQGDIVLKSSLVGSEDIKLEVFAYDATKSNGLGVMIYGRGKNASGIYSWDSPYYHSFSWYKIKSTDIKNIILANNQNLSLYYVNPNDCYIEIDGGFECIYKLKNPLNIVIRVTLTNVSVDKLDKVIVPSAGEFNVAYFKLQDTKRLFFNPNQSPNYVSYSSHRGDKRKYPENTLEAVQAALDMNVDMLEIDVARTKDGVILGIHSNDLGHYATGTGKLSDKMYETEVKDKIFPIDRLGRPWDGTNGTQKINLPKLQDVLALCKGKVMVHVDKADAYIKEVLKLSDALGIPSADLIFKGRYTPDEFYNLYKDKNVLNRINYLPIFFADGLDGWDNTLNNGVWNYIWGFIPDGLQHWATELGLGSSPTWDKIFDKYLNDTRINATIKGFELQWFTEFKPNDLALRDAVTYVKSKNKNALASPMWPEDFTGWWNPRDKVYRRFSTYTDYRGNWDFWFDGANFTTKPFPNIVIEDNTLRMVDYLQARGLRTK